MSVSEIITQKENLGKSWQRYLGKPNNNFQKSTRVLNMANYLDELHYFIADVEYTLF